MLIQVTGDSVTGKMGRTAEKMAPRPPRQALGTLPRHRRPRHAAPAATPQQARDVVAKRYGRDYAESLVTTNPMAVFTGKPFEPQDEPTSLYEEFKPKGWFGRMIDSLK